MILVTFFIYREKIELSFAFIFSYVCAVDAGTQRGGGRSEPSPRYARISMDGLLPIAR